MRCIRITISAIAFVLLISFFVSCCIARKTRGIAVQPIESVTAVTQLEQITIGDLQPRVIISKNKRIIINDNYDLRGRMLVLDDGCTIDFRGGSFSNGYILGSNTKIAFKDEPIFNKVIITGTWNVPVITTDMFKDLNYENSLADVVALTNENVQNQVLIKDQNYDYPVKVTSVGVFEAPLKLKSNTDLQLDGTIRLIPTNLFQYRIMIIKDCENVRIQGKGAIYGDRAVHDYNIDEAHKAWRSHEWGHGVKISNSKHIEVSGISVSDCTGDSFSLGENSSHIVLDGVTANGSRRQGVTIAIASDVVIKNCRFVNIGRINGTPPGAAVDIEPDNTECVVKNISIANCEIHNCVTGVKSWCYAYGSTRNVTINGEMVEKREGRHYVNLSVNDCEIDGVENAFSLASWDMIDITGCSVSNTDYFLRNSMKNTSVRNNTIECKILLPDKVIINSCFVGNSLNLKNDIEIHLNNSVFDNNKTDSRTRVKARII